MVWVADGEGRGRDVAARPLTSVPLPIVVAPSLNFTVPLGVPAPGATGLTVAVKVTAWPNTEGFVDETSVVVVSPLLTTWLSAFDVLPLKFASPLYTAP